MREKLVIRMAELCDYIVTKHNLQILFVPMVKTDERTFFDCMAKMKEDSSLLAYYYDYRVVRAAIGSAKFLFTLKHHPIIFAMANSVPTIAVAVDDYYRHKNRGALAWFGMAEWILDLNGLSGTTGIEKLDAVIRRAQELRNQINSHCAELEKVILRCE